MGCLNKYVRDTCRSDYNNRLSQGTERRSVQISLAPMEDHPNECKLGDKISTKGVNGSTNEVLDTDKYMNIDEFMNVLRDVELITPFGKVQGASYTDVPQVDFQALHATERDFTLAGKVIPCTPTVLQVIDMERRLREVDTNKLVPYSKQNSRQIVEDSVTTNYLFLLVSRRATETD